MKLNNNNNNNNKITHFIIEQVLLLKDFGFSSPICFSCFSCFICFSCICIVEDQYTYYVYLYIICSFL